MYFLNVFNLFIPVLFELNTLLDKSLKLSQLPTN